MQKNIWNVDEPLVRESEYSCKYLTFQSPKEYTWNIDMPLSIVSTANAQANTVNNAVQSSDFLSVPLYIVIIVFILFTVTMSLIYMYHWVKFNLNDPFIKNFSAIYFLGLCLLLVPLLFNLLI